ncbi:hypothetical protein OEZ85_011018 [Tetradesmus obliquus]|uniref:Uncharacterized protein n=1 Tax=Tetradesmus obliquus TaxID=3088 RepID=A0ABY8TP00_TETOB|nr:hypothetical protein OEZ85_011018 [Tetradesmus obliquus]
MAQLLVNVDPSSIAFNGPQKNGPIYVMRPAAAPVLLQTPAVTCVAQLGPEDRKIQVQLDAVTEDWIRAFEATFKDYAKANTTLLFNKELDPEFIDESFRSCLPPPGAKAPLAITMANDAAVFLHTHELLTREEVAPGVQVNLLLEITCIQFGKKWFTPKLRVASLRIPPPPPPPRSVPTYESVGWVDDGTDHETSTLAAGADDEDALSIDLDEQPQLHDVDPDEQQPDSLTVDDVFLKGSGNTIIAGLDLQQILVLVAAAAAAYWLYKKYYAAPTEREGYKDNVKETAAEKTGCAKSLIGNYLTCDKYANDFQGRQKSAVERYQEQLSQQRETAAPLVPDVKLPPLQDYVLPQSSTHGKWDRIADVRGGIDVAYAGSLTTVSPAAIDAAMAAGSRVPAAANK